MQNNNKFMLFKH